MRILALDRDQRRVRHLGESAAWNFQQGSMLQWLAGAAEPTVVFNDFAGDDLVTRLVNLEGHEVHRLPLPVQALHGESGAAASINYNALLTNRIDYAYSRPARNQDRPAAKDGLFLLDVASGAVSLRLPLPWFLEQAPRPDMASARHWLNHAMFSPSGRHLVVMHRWGTDRWRRSRLYSVPTAGGEPTLLLDRDMVSHYHWLDDRRIVAYCRADQGDAYYVLDAETAAAIRIDNAPLQALGDGHPAVARGRGLVVTDTYPDRRGVQALVVFDPVAAGGTLLEVARLAHSPAYHGHERCDLHPRWHPDRGQIAVDSVLDGRRRCWILDADEALERTFAPGARKAETAEGTETDA